MRPKEHGNKRDQWNTRFSRLAALTINERIEKIEASMQGYDMDSNMGMEKAEQEIIVMMI